MFLLLGSTSAEAARTALVVALGFSSCDEADVWPLADELARKIRQSEGEAPAVFYSCFGSGVDTFDLRVMRNGFDERVFTVDDYASRVARLAPRVHLVGHSHGAWLLLRTAARLPRNVEIATIATIDPISYVQCRPQSITRNVLGSLVTMRDNPGCQNPPLDLRPSFRAIRARAGRWLNAFQTQFQFVHSGRIDEADENYRFPSPYEAYDFRSHTEIRHDRRVWERIQWQVDAARP